jgi:hypothetical protein
MKSPMANETTDILHLKRLEAQGPPTKAPLQKLPDEKPIDAARGLRQPGDFVKVPIILAAQLLNPRGVRYALVAGGLPALCARVTMLDLSHGER